MSRKAMQNKIYFNEEEIVEETPPFANIAAATIEDEVLEKGTGFIEKSCAGIKQS